MIEEVGAMIEQVGAMIDEAGGISEEAGAGRREEGRLRPCPARIGFRRALRPLNGLGLAIGSNERRSYRPLRQASAATWSRVGHKAGQTRFFAGMP